MYKKITTIEEYSDVGQTTTRDGIKKKYAPCIRTDIPLMIKLLEYAHEKAMSDDQLHMITENMVDMSEYGRVLTMNDFDNIVETAVTPVVGTVTNPS